MNFKDDYLWDRTGEPDPEIQQLEQILGTLRYQPRPLEIPAGLAPVQKRSAFPRFLAIAATIAIMLLGVGLWLTLNKHQPTDLSKDENKPAVTGGGEQRAGVAPKRVEERVAPSPVPENGSKPLRHRLNPGVTSHEFARNQRSTRSIANTLALAAERKEAEAAKEQLMLALRVVSSKLSYAQKKAQEINSENMVHNQHKTG